MQGSGLAGGGAGAEGETGKEQTELSEGHATELRAKMHVRRDHGVP